jgi:hypothetical protein
METSAVADPGASPESLEAELEALQARLRAGEDGFKLRLRLGWLLASVGRPGDAVPHFRAACEAAPEDPWPWFHLATAQQLPRKWRAWVDGIIRQCRR